MVSIHQISKLISEDYTDPPGLIYEKYTNWRDVFRTIMDKHGVKNVEDIDPKTLHKELLSADPHYAPGELNDLLHPKMQRKLEAVQDEEDEGGGNEDDMSPDEMREHLLEISESPVALVRNIIKSYGKYGKDWGPEELKKLNFKPKILAAIVKVLKKAKGGDVDREGIDDAKFDMDAVPEILRNAGVKTSIAQIMYQVKEHGVDALFKYMSKDGVFRHVIAAKKDDGRVEDLVGQALSNEPELMGKVAEKATSDTEKRFAVVQALLGGT